MEPIVYKGDISNTYCDSERCGTITVNSTRAAGSSIIVARFFSKLPPITVREISESTDSDANYFFHRVRLIISDQSGTIYSGSGALEADRATNTIVRSDFLSAFVSCGNCCSGFELLCESEDYPGWVCKPIPPMDSKVVEMYRQLKKVR